MCSGSEAGSYSRLKNSCITQLKDQGPARTSNESKEEEEEEVSIIVIFSSWLPAIHTVWSTTAQPMSRECGLTHVERMWHKCPVAVLHLVRVRVFQRRMLDVSVCIVFGMAVVLQGYLAHKKPPPP